MQGLMGRLVLLGVVLLSWLMGPAAGMAAVEGAACEREPTDQQIRYGDLVTCAIDQIGDSDTFRFAGGSGDTVKVQIARLGGGFACFQLFDPSGSALDFTRCSNTTREYLLSQTGSHTIVILESNIDRLPNMRWHWIGSIRRRLPPCRSITTR